MTTEIIWIMDSDLCERCDGMLDNFGICPLCGYDGIDEEEWEEWDNDTDWDVWDDREYLANEKKKL